MGDRLNMLAWERRVIASLSVPDDLIGSRDMRDHQTIGIGFVFRLQRSDPFGFPDNRLEMIGDTSAETIAPLPELDVRHVAGHPCIPSVYPGRTGNRLII